MKCLKTYNILRTKVSSLMRFHCIEVYTHTPAVRQFDTSPNSLEGLGNIAQVLQVVREINLALWNGISIVCVGDSNQRPEPVSLVRQCLCA